MACRLPLNHSRLCVSSSHPLHLLLKPPSLCLSSSSQLSFSTISFSIQPVLSRPVLEVCVTTSLTASQKRQIGLYLGKWNINKERKEGCLLEDREGVQEGAVLCSTVQLHRLLNKGLKNGLRLCAGEDWLPQPPFRRHLPPHVFIFSLFCFSSSVQCRGNMYVYKKISIYLYLSIHPFLSLVSQTGHHIK